MSIKKPLVLGSDGTIQQLQSGDSLDITLPSGGDVVLMTLAENAMPTSVLCSTTTGVVKADKNDDSKVRVVGFATSAGNSGDEISVRVSAQQGGFTGLITGSPVFLDVGGAVTQTTPTSGFSIRLGVALSSTDILVEPAQPIKL
jgi:hypothetical protein